MQFIIFEIIRFSKIIFSEISEIKFKNKFSLCKLSQRKKFISNIMYTEKILWKKFNYPPVNNKFYKIYF